MPQLLLHFCILLVNSNIDVELDRIFGKPKKGDANCILSVGRYCQVLTHKSNTFLLKISHSNQWKKTPRNCPFPLRHVDSHLINPSLDRPHSPPQRQLDRFTHFRTTTQQRPHWLQWYTPNSPQNSPLPSTITTHSPASNTPIPPPTPLTILNGIWIQSAVLPQYTFWTDRQTHTHTDRQMMV